MPLIHASHFLEEIQPILELRVGIDELYGVELPKHEAAEKAAAMKTLDSCLLQHWRATTNELAAALGGTVTRPLKESDTELLTPHFALRDTFGVNGGVNLLTARTLQEEAATIGLFYSSAAIVDRLEAILSQAKNLRATPAKKALEFGSIDNHTIFHYSGVPMLKVEPRRDKDAKIEVVLPHSLKLNNARNTSLEGEGVVSIATEEALLGYQNGRLPLSSVKTEITQAFHLVAPSLSAVVKSLFIQISTGVRIMPNRVVLRRDQITDLNVYADARIRARKFGILLETV